MNKPDTLAKVPVLSDKRLQIQFSEAIVETFSLRVSKPLGYEKRIAELHLQQRELFDKIESEEVEVACWVEGYSLAERRQELKALKEEVAEEDLLALENSLEELLEEDENNLKESVDFCGVDSILDGIENEIDFNLIDEDINF